LEYLLPSETLIEVHRKILHKDNFSNDLDKLLYELYQEKPTFEPAVLIQKIVKDKIKEIDKIDEDFFKDFLYLILF